MTEQHEQHPGSGDENDVAATSGEQSGEATVYPFPAPAANTPGEGEPTPTGPADTDAPAEDGDDAEAGSGAEVVPLVDQPEPASGSVPARQEKREPLLPPWARSQQEFRDTARWALGYATHAAAYHGLRCPLYLARLLWRAPRGARLLLGGLVRWLSDAEGRPVREAAARREEAGEYIKLSRVRDGRIRARSFLFAATAAAGIAAVLAGHAMLPALVEWAAVATAVAAVGWWGAPADQPIASRAVEMTKVPKLTSDAVTRALSALGISQITQALGKDGEGVGYPKPISRDGKGWRADVDLPHGVTPGDIMEKRAKLASGLRRPLGCVWPEADNTEHAARLVLWVGDQDMRKAKQPAWALRKGGQVDLFGPQPFGTDQRGRWVDLTLMFTSVVIGSIPRMGKTFALRELLLIAALDPRVELHSYDLKGTGDLDPLEPVTHRHGVGDDPDEIKAAIVDMRGLRDELRRRAKAIRQLAKQGHAPENKVTPELASKKSLGLHPIVVGVDECQVWFENDKYGEEFEEIMTDLVKRGPALGFITILATQRPDARSIPTGIADNVSTRFCLKVRGQNANDMVLGTSMYKQGVRATTFAWEDKGIGYLVGEGADAQIVRTVAGLDGPASDKVVAHARKLRENAGTLSGHAIGHQPDIETETHRDTLLEDILAVVTEKENKIWNERVITRLAEFRPEVYGTFHDTADLTAALKRHGIKTAQVWGSTDDGKGASRIGITRADITKTITERDQKPEAS